MARRRSADPQAVFVYGTLKPGRSRWHAFAPFVAPGADLRETTVRGSLWDSGHTGPP